jgi:hypothetical protein
MNDSDGSTHSNENESETGGNESGTGENQSKGSDESEVSPQHQKNQQADEDMHESSRTMLFGVPPNAAALTYPHVLREFTL